MCVLLRELGDAEQVLKVAALGQRPTLESADGKTAVLSGSDESRAAKEGEGWGASTAEAACYLRVIGLNVTSARLLRTWKCQGSEPGMYLGRQSPERGTSLVWPRTALGLLSAFFPHPPRPLPVTFPFSRHSDTPSRP